MISLFISVALLLQEIPFKAKEEFEIKLDYQFKNRPGSDQGTAIHFDESQKERERRTSTDLLPYLVLNVKVLKINDGAVRARIVDNKDRTTTVRKLSEGTVIPVIFGFTDDVKDRVAPYTYDISFLSADKKTTSHILLHVDEDGTFLVNGEKRGKL